MMTKMIRPCTLPSVWVDVFEGQDIPFMIDAIRFEGLHYTPSTSYNPEEYFIVRVDLCNPRITAMAYHPKENVEHLMRRTLGVIYEALNAPVQVTQAVLDAMNKVPEAQFWHVEGSVNTRLKWDDALKTFTVNGQTLSITDYIQADCLLALEVLLQFYTDGTSILK